MSDEISQNGSPLGGRQLFGGMPNWMTTAMRALENTPPAFRNTVNRALEAELDNNPSFGEMMAEEAANIVQAAQASTARHTVTVMTPDEQVAATSLSALRGGFPNQPLMVPPQRIQMLHQVHPAPEAAKHCQRPHQH